MHKVLERIILDRLIKHREEITCDEQAGSRPGQFTIEQVFIVRRVFEIWQRYSKLMRLAFLDFEVAFDSPHRGRLLNTGPFLFNCAIDDIMRRTVAQCATDILLAPSECS